MGMPKKGSLLEIDVRALADLVDTLMWCHIKTDKMEEFPPVVERLRANIKDTAWQRKIVYFHAMHALWPGWDEAAGRRELKKLGPLTEDDDVETLQLYLDLFDATLAFSDKQTIIDRILAETNKFADRLHYKGTRAALYLTIGDLKRAEAELEESVTEVRTNHDVEELSQHERYRFAMTLDFLGSLRRDDTLLAEAIDQFNILLQQDELSSKGRANLLELLGQTHRHRGEWEKARTAHEQSLQLGGRAVNKVFLAECLFQLDQADKATKLFGEIDQNDLEPAERVDYAYLAASLAIHSGERTRLENAKTVLRSIEVPDPFFRERRDAYLLNVQEAISSGSSRPLTKRTRALLANIARSATNYLILKPSFMGIGIDIGKIFEDLARKSESSSVNQPKGTQSKETSTRKP
jgi:tetratricopeptide (TPR) repeat protein